MHWSFKLPPISGYPHIHFYWTYADIQLLYDFWALQDAELSEECPAELAEGKPAICICDNDDFVCDTLSGAYLEKTVSWVT